MNNRNKISSVTLQNKKLPHASQPFARKPLAVAILSAAIAGCGTGDDNAVFVPTPSAGISEPFPLAFATLAEGPVDVFGSVSARSPDLLVDEVSISNAVSTIDASGNIQNNGTEESDGSTTFPSLLSRVFSPPLGNDANGQHWVDSFTGLSMGSNLLLPEITFGETAVPLAGGEVVRGHSWMREVAIQYDASGNLYALDRIKSGFIKVDTDTGQKTDVPDFSGDAIVDPVDFIINGSSAFVLDAGSSGIYEVTSFSSGGTAAAVTDCSATTGFSDPVAFDIDFDASGNVKQIFVADRGLKEIVQIDSGNNCSIIATPDVEVDDPVDGGSETVQGLKLNLPTDIVYHAASEKLFVTGEWVGFTLVAENVLDASGNQVLDASGNPVQHAVTQSLPSAPLLIEIPLSGDDALERASVGYSAQPVLDSSGNQVQMVDGNNALVFDASGNAVFEEITFRVLSPSFLALNDDDLFIFDESIFSGSLGVAAIDVSMADASGNYLARPVSGDIFQEFNTDSTLAVRLGFNPNVEIPFGEVNALAVDEGGQILTALSLLLGSYINVDLALPDDPCTELDFSNSDPQEGSVLQCEFVGSRMLVPGGATVVGNDSVSEEAIDDGYVITSRADFTGVSSADYRSAVSVGDEFLKFNASAGVPSLNFVDVIAPSATDNLFDQVLVSDARALAVILDESDPSALEYLLVDNLEDRVLSIEGSEDFAFRSVLSPSDESVVLADPLAGFVRRPLLESMDASGNSIVDASQPTSYFVLDRSESDLIQVVLEPVTDESPEQRGDRALVNVDVGTCNLAVATAMRSIRRVSSESFPSDFNGDGDVSDIVLSADGEQELSESDASRFEDYASLFVVSDDDLLEIDLLANECVLRMDGAFSTSIVSLDLDVEDETDASGNTIRRNYSFIGLRLDASGNELIELQCAEGFDPVEAFDCPLSITHEFTLNDPVSPVAMSMDWNARVARIFDDKSNSVFSVDLAPRNSEGEPLRVDDPGASFTGQTVISTRGLPLNCDQENDEEGCRNL